MKYFIAVDIGIAGGIAILSEKGKINTCIPMPTMEVVINKKKKSQYDLQAINKFFIDLPKGNYQAILERLRPMPQQASQTGFSLGYGSAVFETLFTVYGIRYEKVEPRVWQKNMFKGYNYTSDQTKIISVQVAKTLAPEQSLLTTPRCSKPNDGLSDSICMAFYLRKLNN